MNLYSGIGGNRKLWQNVEVTAVEQNAKIAEIYSDFFPNDNIIIGDAHEYLIKHFAEYDFVWTSPPCPTHSRLRTLQQNIVYPDMRLYSEILVLQNFAKGFYVVENVLPYYEPLIKPQILHRHAFWTNFQLHYKEFPKLKTCKIGKEREVLQNATGFNLDKYTGVDKRLLLRNAVLPELGQHVFNCALRKVPPIQEGLFGTDS